MSCINPLIYCAQPNKKTPLVSKHKQAPYSEERRLELVREINEIPACSNICGCNQTFNEKMDELFYPGGPWQKPASCKMDLLLCSYRKGSTCKKPWGYVIAAGALGILASGGVLSTMIFQHTTCGYVGSACGGIALGLPSCGSFLCGCFGLVDDNIPSETGVIDFLSQLGNWPILKKRLNYRYNPNEGLENNGYGSGWDF